MAGIFDEANMRQVLGACLPEGETLAAGIHAITLQVNQKKTSYFDVYAGVTEHYLLVAECEERKYLTAAYPLLPDLRKTFRDGSFLKLQMPKRGGLGGGMPHHAEYREKILARLERFQG